MDVTFYPETENRASCVEFEGKGKDSLFAVELTGEEILLAFLALPPADMPGYLDNVTKELHARMQYPEEVQRLEIKDPKILLEPVFALLRAAVHETFLAKTPSESK
jgi:hypothetical protein